MTVLHRDMKPSNLLVNSNCELVCNHFIISIYKLSIFSNRSYFILYFIGNLRLWPSPRVPCWHWQRFDRICCNSLVSRTRAPLQVFALWQLCGYLEHWYYSCRAFRAQSNVQRNLCKAPDSTDCWRLGHSFWSRCCFLLQPTGCGAYEEASIQRG